MTTPRILLVDDDRNVSRMLRTSIELSGWECVVIDVPTGEEALHELGRGPVDLLVADIRLPGISGLEVMKAHRRINPESKTIIVTGDPSEEARAEAEAEDVVVMLTKPIGTSLFLEAVASVIKDLDKPVSPRTHPPESRRALMDILKGLREKLDVYAVILLDEFGRVIAADGELPGIDREVTFASLATASNSGLKVSTLMGGLLPANLQYYEGEEYNLFLFNVGAYYNLVIAFERGSGGQRWASIVLTGRKAAQELLDKLASSGLVSVDADTQQILEERRKFNKEKWRVVMVEGEEKGNQEQEEEELLEGAEEVKPEDAQQFWDKALSEQPRGKEVKGDVLS
ncbi:MAG: response regulator, partial [Anaerolineales bacterium]